MSCLFMKAIKKQGKASTAKPVNPEEAKAAVAADLKDLLAPSAGGEGVSMAAYAQLLALLQGMNAGGKFGKHNVNPDDDIAFSAGEFKGSGKVIATGEHGATVSDGSGREHRVHWHEVTGHKPGGKEKASDAKK